MASEMFFRALQTFQFPLRQQNGMSLQEPCDGSAGTSSRWGQQVRTSEGLLGIGSEDYRSLQKAPPGGSKSPLPPLGKKKLIWHFQLVDLLLLIRFVLGLNFCFIDLPK